MPTDSVIDSEIVEYVDDKLTLIGGRCGECGEIDFPRASSCRNCGGDDQIAAVRLSTQGVLWSWTVQRFPPPSPPYKPTGEDFEPYGVGYVELPGEVIVETRLTESDPAKLRVGMPMELVALPALNKTGDPVTTFAFSPGDPE